MRTVGVDLGAEARNTALAVIDWRPGRAVVQRVQTGVTDADVVAAAEGADRIGIDCSFGWPAPFVEFVGRHQGFATTAAAAPADGWRRPLVNRTTDLACAEFTAERTGRAVRPLSVAADLLGHAALRCAVLLARLADAGLPVDRSGRTGAVAETYPAASLALWAVEPRSYKGTRRGQLPTVVDSFAARAAWLDLGAAAAAGRASDHVFDAVVCALAARAVALGRATTPSERQQPVAEIEGWIALPTCELDELVGSG